MSPHAIRLSFATAVLALLVAAVPALAGPPLLCHPYDIGQARSLPWDGSTSWFHGQAGYDVRHLVSDTDALLTPATPVIVRMETIRRAAIYATLDRRVASALVARFGERARIASGPAQALALLDAALLTETLRQMSKLASLSNFRDRGPVAGEAIGDTDGRVLLAMALAARPDDASFRFAAALIEADRDKGAYKEHARRARAGAAQDALLARNLNHVN
jgi:hypothetical protein